MNGIKKKILFVCSANKDRSKTAEDYFASISENYLFESAGTNLKLCNKEGTNPLEEHMLAWADLIVVMEHKHKKWIDTNTIQNTIGKLVVLNIPDVYKYYQPELIHILKQKMKAHL